MDIDKNLKDHVYTLPIEGVNMVEANAGTGKTFNIVLLYLRVIVENGFEPEQILTVTFTRDATKDLNLKLFEGLRIFRDAIQFFHINGKWNTNDETSQNLYLNAIKKGVTSTSILGRVERAMTHFYKASVYTIHGLANQILKSFALESNAPLSFELVKNEAELINQSIEYEILSLIKTFEQFESSKRIITAFVEILNIDDLKKTVKLISSLDKNTFDFYEPELISIESIVNRIKLNENEFLTYADKETLIKELENILGDTLNASFLKKIDTFYTKALNYKIEDDSSDNFIKKLLIKKKKINKDDTLDNYFQIKSLDTFINDVSIITSLITYLSFKSKDRLLTLKSEKNVFGYNDLLLNLSHILDNTDYADGIIQRVNDKYKVVFIDEFQDTDPIQIRIFNALFINQNHTPFFTFGDPKQSIYSFRGADLASYVYAKDIWKPNNYHLLENYRSTKTLLHAVNNLFNNHNSFIYEGITFKHSTFPSNKSNSQQDIYSPSLPVDMVDVKAKNASDYINIVSRDLAHEINNIINNEVNNSKQCVDFKDIVILCSTNNQCMQIKKSLASFGFNSLIIGGNEIFKTLFAEDVFQLFNSILNYTERSSINAFTINPLVLKTPRINFTSVETNYELLRPHLNKALDTWYNAGIEQCFDYLDDLLSITKQLAASEGAERKLTDLYHLLEYLSEIEKEHNFKPNALIDHFSSMIASARTDDNNVDSPTAQRLESDENLINIMTVHKSKGLQYSVVFCPFILPTSTSQFFRDHNVRLPYHIEYNNQSFLHISGKDTKDKKAKFNELKILQQKQEKIRNLYVAFTRAKQKLYIYKITTTQLTDSQQTAYNKTAWSSLESMNRDFWNVENGFNRRCLTSLAVYNNDLVHSTLTGINNLLISPKKLSRNLIPTWIKQSFSALTKKQHTTNSDESEINFASFYEDDQNVVGEEGNEFKGAEFGSIIHDVLEEFAFKDIDTLEGSKQSALNKLVNAKINQYYPSFPNNKDALLNYIEVLLKNCIKIPFHKGYSLSSISQEDLFKEQEFVFDIDTTQLINFLEEISFKYPEHDIIIQELYKLKSPSIRINGFIDLLVTIDNKWYIIDYKTNYIQEGYNKKELLENMISHKYRLQYLIYTCAWVKFQKLLGYSREHCSDNFGGAYYLYLRGMSTNSPTDRGIFFDDIKSDGILDRILFYFW